VSDYCSLFNQTFCGLLFSYLTMTDVTSHVHHKFPVSFLRYIKTKKTCQINQIITENSSMNAPFSDISHKKDNSCTPSVPMLLRGVVRGVAVAIAPGSVRRGPVQFLLSNDSDARDDAQQQNGFTFYLRISQPSEPGKLSM